MSDSPVDTSNLSEEEFNSKVGRFVEKARGEGLEDVVISNAVKFFVDQRQSQQSDISFETIPEGSDAGTFDPSTGTFTPVDTALPPSPNQNILDEEADFSDPASTGTTGDAPLVELGPPATGISATPGGKPILPEGITVDSGPTAIQRSKELLNRVIA